MLKMGALLIFKNCTQKYVIYKNSAVDPNIYFSFF